MFLLLCLLTTYGKIVMQKSSGVFSFVFSCFKSFKIKYFGLSHNRSHNLPEAKQQYQLNEALIGVPVLVLSGDCIFAFGNHFFFDSCQEVTWNFFLISSLAYLINLFPGRFLFMFLFYLDPIEQNEEIPRNASRRYVADQNVHSLKTA